MAQKKHRYLDVVGPMLWVRFLLHRFACDLRALDAQLPQPVRDGESKFILGVSPPPDFSIPEMFRRTFELGKNPDGAYFVEPGRSKVKFNLFQRVVARVPESKHWLLADAAPYFSDETSVDQSAQNVSALLTERSMALLSAECVHAWREHDAKGIAAAERLSLHALATEATPEALTLLLSLLHLAVWHFLPARQGDIANPDLIDALADSCTQCASFIGHLDWVQSSEQGPDLAHRLDIAVQGAVRWLRASGHRSRSPRQSLHRLPTNIVLVRDTAENQQRMRALSLRSSLYWFEPMLDLDDYAELPQDWAAVKRALQLEAAAAAFGAYPA